MQDTDYQLFASSVEEELSLGMKDDCKEKVDETLDQGCFAAAASPSQKNKFSCLYGHINATEGKVFAFFITKAKILK